MGAWLRLLKLDELPQLFNVLAGDMSVVGPRPEVPQYVELYTPEQRRVLSLVPGLTDEASLRYRHESRILQRAPDPERAYVERIMPEKIQLSLSYAANSLKWDSRFAYAANSLKRDSRLSYAANSRKRASP